jgi:hypothetical protein
MLMVVAGPLMEAAEPAKTEPAEPAMTVPEAEQPLVVATSDDDFGGGHSRSRLRAEHRYELVVGQFMKVGLALPYSA